MSQLRKIFAVDRSKFSLTGGIAVGGLLLVIWFAVAQLNEQRYLITVVFAVLTTALSDPGGSYWHRARAMSAYGIVGALMTALAFFVGTQAAGFVVLALFVVTLLAGLAVKFGLHRFSTGMLLNVWFVLAVGLPISFRAGQIHTHSVEPGAGLADRISRMDHPHLHRVAGQQTEMEPGAHHRRPRRAGRSGRAHPPGGAICTGARLGNRRLSRYRLRVA